MKKFFVIAFALIISIATFAQDGYQVGSIVKDFKLKNVDGKMVSMADYKEAEGLIIIFTCNTCPFSVATEERVKELDKKYAAQGYPVVAINPNDAVRRPGDSFDEMVQRAKEYEYTFAYLHDATQEIATEWGATRTPHVYLLKKEDKGFKVAYIGAIDDSTMNPDNVDEKYLEAAIAALKAGKQPDPNLTKAIGCTIKWAQ